MDYKIEGIDTQFLHISLNSGESIISEAGSMISMDIGISMGAMTGDGSQEQTLWEKVVSTGERAITGAGMFLTMFTNNTQAIQNISFAAPYPGKVIAIDLSEHQNSLICHKDSFLCAEKGTEITVAFQKKFLSGIFGGDGFILQKLQGNKMAFIHGGGTVFSHTLEAGQTLYVDSGCVVAFDQSVSFNLEQVKGIKTMLFSGEGLFLAKLTGPGKVLLQSMPFSRLVSNIASRIQVNTSRNAVGEGLIASVISKLFR